MSEILGQLVNPWTCLVYVALALFHRELRGLFLGVGRVTADLKDIAFKDFKLSIKDREAIAVELARPAPEATAPLDEATARRQKLLAEKITSTEISEGDLVAFMELFSLASTVVVDQGSRHNVALYRLQDSGAVSAGRFSVAMPSRRRLQEWTLTPEGAKLRVLLLRNRGT